MARASRASPGRRPSAPRHAIQASASNLLDTLGLNAQTLPPEAIEPLKEHFIAGWGGYPLIGTRDQVVKGLKDLADVGLDGTLLSWPRYQEGMAHFQRETHTPWWCRRGCGNRLRFAADQGPPPSPSPE